VIERQCINMVRDGIKDKAYFDSAINELDKRVSLYKQRLSTGGVVSQNIKLAKSMVVNMEYQIILLRYSRGDNLADIRETMMQMIDLFAECIDQSEYFSVTKFLSLAILLDGAIRQTRCINLRKKSQFRRAGSSRLNFDYMS